MRPSPNLSLLCLPVVTGLLLCGAGAAIAAPPSDAMAPRHTGARCDAIPTRAATRMAELETRLKLTPAQTPLFARWKAVRMDSAGQMQARCKEHVPQGGKQAMSGPPSPVDRMAREEDRLQQRLAALRAERPALTALYASLSDEQKAGFAPPHRPHGMMMRHMRPAPGGETTPPPPPAPAP